MSIYRTEDGTWLGYRSKAVPLPSNEHGVLRFARVPTGTLEPVGPVLDRTSSHRISAASAPQTGLRERSGRVADAESGRELPKRWDRVTVLGETRVARRIEVELQCDCGNVWRRQRGDLFHARSRPSECHPCSVRRKQKPLPARNGLVDLVREWIDGRRGMVELRCACGTVWSLERRRWAHSTRPGCCRRCVSFLVGRPHHRKQVAS